MAQKPIFVATHPRACSTAFEMVFMTRPDTLKCVHEPFGDAYYYGPERLHSRYEDDIKARQESNFSESTYQTIVDSLDNDATEGKRLVIKDMAQYLVPPEGKPVSIAPSLAPKKRGVGTGDNEAKPVKQPPYPYDTEPEPGNPTVVPTEILKKFHFAFLIRHPKKSIPSYYRCTVPPQDEITGFHGFMPCEAGYSELRSLFDYLKNIGEINTAAKEGVNGTNGTNGANGVNGPANGHTNGVKVCIIDADDLLDRPAEVIEAFCKSVGIDYHPGMLSWETPEEQARAKEAFAKWPGFHDDALEHTSLKPRNHKSAEDKTDAEDDASWTKKFGKEASKVIRDTVNENVADYEYLKSFALKF